MIKQEELILQTRLCRQQCQRLTSLCHKKIKFYKNKIINHTQILFHSFIIYIIEWNVDEIQQKMFYNKVTKNNALMNYLYIKIYIRESKSDAYKLCRFCFTWNISLFTWKFLFTYLLQFIYQTCMHILVKYTLKPWYIKLWILNKHFQCILHISAVSVRLSSVGLFLWSWSGFLHCIISLKELNT